MVIDTLARNRKMAQDELQKLCKIIRTERDAQSLILESMAEATINHDNIHDLFQEQTIIREKYNHVLEQQKHSQEKCLQLKNDVRNCQQKLRVISRQQNQVHELPAVMEQLELLEQKVKFWEEEKKRFDISKTLVEQMNFYQNECDSDELIIRRLQKEIAEIGDLDLFEEDIQDQQADFDSFVRETSDWLAHAAQNLEKTTLKGKALRKKYETMKSKKSHSQINLSELEYMLQALRKEFIGQKVTYDTTCQNLEKFKQKEIKLKNLRKDLLSKKKQRKGNENEIAKLQERIADSQNVLIKLKEETTKLGEIDYDANVHGNDLGTLKQQRKIFSHLQKIAADVVKKEHYERVLEELSNELTVTTEILQFQAAELENVAYNQEVFEEIKGKYDLSRANLSKIHKKFSETKNALHAAEESLLNKLQSKKRDAKWQRDIATSERDIFAALVEKATICMDALLASANQKVNSDNTKLDLNLSRDAGWWQSLPTPRKRLAQLCLSFACRSLLHDQQIQVPQFLVLDDSLAPEFEYDRFRHKPVFQYLQKYFSQIIFIAHGVKQKTVFKAIYVLDT